MDNRYSKAYLTEFAKELARAHRRYLDVMCEAEEIVKSDIGREFNNEIEENLLVEIAKLYAKYVCNECNVDIDNAETQDCQNIINAIVSCCEENNWFR